MLQQSWGRVQVAVRAWCVGLGSSQGQSFNGTSGKSDGAGSMDSGSQGSGTICFATAGRAGCNIPALTRRSACASRPDMAQ